MIDWKRVSELRCEVGEDEFAVILRLFLDEFEGVLKRLPGHEAAGLIADLHFLKDGARTLGFSLFGSLCDEAERVANRGQAEGVDLDRLASCYIASKLGLMQALNAGSSVRTGLP